MGAEGEFDEEEGDPEEGGDEEGVAEDSGVAWGGTGFAGWGEGVSLGGGRLRGEGGCTFAVEVEEGAEE